MDSKEVAKNLIGGAIVGLFGLGLMRHGVKRLIDGLEGLTGILAEKVKDAQ